jgi:hypothetical protein
VLRLFSQSLERAGGQRCPRSDFYKFILSISELFYRNLRVSKGGLNTRLSPLLTRRLLLLEQH